MSDRVGRGAHRPAGQKDIGAPDTIRTCDLCLRRVALYPAELRAQCLAVQRPNESNPLGVCCDIVKPVFPALSYDDTARGRDHVPSAIRAALWRHRLEIFGMFPSGGRRLPWRERSRPYEG